MSGKAIRETLGFLAVVASMVFVGLEIQQNTRALRATAIQESIHGAFSRGGGSPRVLETCGVRRGALPECAWISAGSPAFLAHPTVPNES